MVVCISRNAGVVWRRRINRRWRIHSVRSPLDWRDCRHCCATTSLAHVVGTATLATLPSCSTSGMSAPTSTHDAPSKPPMRFRRTRIVASVFFGPLTVVLCTLWVRSYWSIDYVRYTGSTMTTIGYRQGVICYVRHKLLQPPRQTYGWEVNSLPVTTKNPYSQFRWSMTPQAASARVPFWLPSLVCFVSITAQWMPRPSRRYSLLTLLIATTLVAVALGLVVWLVR